MWKKLCLGAMVVGVGIGAGSIGMAQDVKGFLPYQNKNAVRQGAKLYAKNCASCHGVKLEGESDWRTPDQDGLMKAPPHDENGHTWHHPDMQLFMITKHGTAKLVGNGYESRMPGFAETLSDVEIVEILAYIKSTWPQRVIQMHNERNG